MENISEYAQEAEQREVQLPPNPAAAPRKDFAREDARYKSPVMATIMSLMPGLGQIYIGYYRQGFINIIVVAGIITLLNSRSIGRLNMEPFFGLFLAFFWLYNMVDAYRKSVFYNQALAGLGAFELPEEEKLGTTRGSLLTGLIMIAVGGIALSYTRYDMPLDWLEVWWPLAPILLGLYLVCQPIAQWMKKRKQRRDRKLPGRDSGTRT
jgi:hypothetical protein